jgi:hypothetical protein
MKIVASFIICLSLTFSCHAQKSVVLPKGKEAPFDGVLSDADQMKEYRKVSEENKLLGLENLKLKDLAVTQDQRISLYQEELKVVKDDYKSLERKTFWSNLGYFALGVLVTGFAAKVAIESTR